MSRRLEKLEIGGSALRHPLEDFLRKCLQFQKIPEYC
jgi:hypothetical protein